MEIPYVLKVAGLLGLMLLWVPLAGGLASGSWRGAWRYTKDWGRAMGVVLALAAVLWLIALPFMP